MHERVAAAMICGFFFAGSQQVNAAEPLTELMAATCKVANSGSTATAFVIARPGTASQPPDRILVTAAHVLEKMTGNECRMVLREPQSDGTFHRAEVPLAIRSEDGPLWVRHPQVDVAAIKLELPAGKTTGDLPLDRIADADMTADGTPQLAAEVWIPCFPARLESTPSGFPVLRRGTVASFPLTPVNHYRTWLVDYSSFGGDSGAPVMLLHRSTDARQVPRGLIVGLMTSQHRETTRIVSPVEEKTVHRPLGLGIAVHAVFIRQTIDRIPR